MPIRINLLAEAQAAEESRRKDPVKKGYVVSGLILFLAIFWSSSLQMKILSSKSRLDQSETKWTSIEKSYKIAVDARRQSLEAGQKLGALYQYTTNRFLLGNLLDGLHQIVNGNEDFQVVRLKTEQTFLIAEEQRGRTNVLRASASPKQVGATEKVTMLIDALDTNPQPGGQGRLKEAIATVPFFQASLQKTNGVLLTSLSAPQVGPLGGKPFVTFTLQCSFQERVR